ncbi:hypothetical protein OC846_005084 [Tilletia horrida]|uniref:Uncharacterized protein n=1 Tax=Tilletia horrida TaxID=155126 RepID=A0AAN6GNN3_9BASI|nr:hypothetical protein OC845_005575 [Tilletia horrida]KAK0546873.1 hypothetical protein OC846_005084 [Tilletia horrida]
MLLRPTLRLLAQQAYKPSIRFPDRSQHQQQQHSAGSELHPHPAAPPEIVKDFSHFQEVFSSGPHFHPEKLQSASGSASASSSGGGGGASSGAEVVEDVHDLPPRFWKTSSLLIEEDEMELIMSGGASSRA